ncbi:MAG: decaprenyl-phosphate phosphoribosyltransferase [Thermodesulfobacteriota bacterium]|nr:decaprenyl-phosphate phosphoribosyltransferase [Thermodesulfobacteriota bacterium]
MILYLKLIRPHQWLKNLMLFFPPFLAGEIISIAQLSKVISPFIAFSLAASATYVFNDIIDRHADLLHPQKCQRPLPAGVVSITAAWWVAGVLIVVAFIVGLLWTQPAVVWLLAYVVLSLLYTLFLKNVLLVDLFTIAAFFIIRLQAGGAAFGVNISTWLFLSVFLLALFLSSGKRLGELNMLGEDAASHRGSLTEYSPQFLNAILCITASTVLVTYTMYCITHTVLVYSVPLCTYGLLRYIYRVQHGQNGDPTASLLCDRHLLIVGVSWVLMVGFDIYA